MVVVGTSKFTGSFCGTQEVSTSSRTLSTHTEQVEQLTLARSIGETMWDHRNTANNEIETATLSNEVDKGLRILSNTTQKFAQQSVEMLSPELAENNDSTSGISGEIEH